MRASTPSNEPEDIEEISCAIEKGTFRRRMVRRKFVMRNPRWLLVMFQAQDWKQQAGEWTRPYIILRRYVRTAGRWRKHSGITLRNEQTMICFETGAAWDAMADVLADIGIDVGEAVQDAERGAPRKRGRPRIWGADVTSGG